MKIVTIVGARPQFIKAAAVSRALSNHNKTNESDPIHEVIVHTGQHYDANMSRVFFDELEIPKPHINLGVGSGSHGWQTAQMLTQIETVLQDEKPDWVLVYGDTNSTLAGALAAVKLHVAVAHVEAGLRSFNRRMPEEHNRVLTDHCADQLFCPTRAAVNNLKNEGIASKAHLVGDVMYDSVLYNTQLAENKSRILEELNLHPGAYALATVHRAENTDDSNRLGDIFQAFEELSASKIPVVVPIHPRTKKIIEKLRIPIASVQLIEPVPYLGMLLLEKNAKYILTDSGGVQKEAYWLKVPCVTLRDETEWVETLASGWNILSGVKTRDIIKSMTSYKPQAIQPELFGDGNSSEKILDVLISY